MTKKVISFSSTKGGAGKSTSALLLALHISRFAPVTILDADPRRTVAQWSGKADKPENITVVDGIDEGNFFDQIDEAAKRSTYILIDLEGVASRLHAYAITESDLVVIPTQANFADSDGVTQTLDLIRKAERQTGRKVPHVVSVNRTSKAVRGRLMKHVVEDLKEAKIPTLKTEIYALDAYAALMGFGGTLEQLDRKLVPGVDKAVENANAYAEELLALVSDENTEQSKEVA